MPPDRSAIALLAGLLACASPTASPPENESPTGTVRLTVSTTGPGAVSSLQLNVDDRAPVTIESNGSVDITELPVGSSTVQLHIPGHCLANHHAPQVLPIAADSITTFAWSIRCPSDIAGGIVSTRYAIPGDGLIWIADAQARNGTPLGGPPGIEGSLPTLNPARTLIAHESHLGRLAISGVDGGETVTTDITGISAIDWSPDGTRLLVVHDRQSQLGGKLAVIWPDGVVERALRPESVHAARWAPDGNRVAYREGSYIFVEDLDTGVRTNTGHILVLPGSGLAWSPDGTRLAYVDRHAQSIFVMRADGSDRQAVATYPGSTGDIDWDEGGQLLVLLPMPFPEHNRHVPHVVPSAGGPPALLHDDGGSHLWARWVDQ